MALLTEHQDATTFRHVVYNVAGFDEDSNDPINLALSRMKINDLTTFLFLDEIDFHQITYMDNNQVTHTLRHGPCRRIELLHRFVHHLINANDNKMIDYKKMPL